MAQTHGNVANYPAEKRRELFMRMLILVMLVEAGTVFLLGVSVGQRWFPNLTGWAAVAMIWGSLAVMMRLPVTFWLSVWFR